MSVPQTIQHGEIVEPKAPAPMQTAPSESGAILSMIERASRDPSVDIEKFERLMAMKERMEADAARRAFNAAVADAKGEIGPIVKNRVVDFSSQKGRTHYRHEDFAEVTRTVDPVLKRYGLFYRYKSHQDGPRLAVTCVLSHRDGYSEETTLVAGRDDTGNKNSHQGVASAATYLQRYTLKLALGLSAAEQDDDGRAAGAVEIDRDALMDEGRRVVTDDGMAALGVWWTKTLTKEHRKVLGSSALEDLKKLGEG